MLKRPVRPALWLLLASQSGAADLKDVLAPTGTLRAAFLGGNPVQGRVDAASGAVPGPAADFVRELPRRLGAPFRIAPSPDVRGEMEAIKTHAADLGFLAFDATRPTEVDFSQPFYALACNSYMVQAGSALRSADADRSGIRISEPKGDSGDLHLSRTLQHAELKSTPGLNPEAAQKMLSAGGIDAYAANRQRSTGMAARFPGLRLLPDNFLAAVRAIVVRKGKAADAGFLKELIEEARASGFPKVLIERAKLRGVEASPPKLW